MLATTESLVLLERSAKCIRVRPAFARGPPRNRQQRTSSRGVSSLRWRLHVCPHHVCCHGQHVLLHGRNHRWRARPTLVCPSLWKLWHLPTSCRNPRPGHRGGRRPRVVGCTRSRPRSRSGRAGSRGRRWYISLRHGRRRGGSCTRGSAQPGHRPRVGRIVHAGSRAKAVSHAAKLRRHVRSISTH